MKIHIYSQPEAILRVVSFTIPYRVLIQKLHNYINITILATTYNTQNYFNNKTLIVLL